MPKLNWHMTAYDGRALQWQQWTEFWLLGYQVENDWVWLHLSRTVRSAFTGVNGRAITAYSTRQKAVFKTSSLRRRVPSMVYSTLSKLRTILSQMSSWCGALDGLNLHLIPLCAISAAMSIVFQFSIRSRSSFSTPIKFVPLSDQILTDVPRQKTNRLTPIIQEQVSKDETISTWTARVDKWRKIPTSSQSSDERWRRMGRNTPAG